MSEIKGEETTKANVAVQPLSEPPSGVKVTAELFIPVEMVKAILALRPGEMIAKMIHDKRASLQSNSPLCSVRVVIERELEGLFLVRVEWLSYGDGTYAWKAFDEWNSDMPMKDFDEVAATLIGYHIMVDQVLAREMKPEGTR